MDVVRGAGLVGREAELERIDRMVASLDAGAAATIICGEAGIGKTEVWRSGVAQAEAEGVRVLRSRCAEVEMPIAFGALADLFEPVLEEIESELPAPQLRALMSAFGRTAAEGRTDWLVLARGVLGTVRALALDNRLLIAVDDLQWVDAGSRRVLAWALRRAASVSVGVLATLRDDRAPDPLAVADALPAGRFDVVALGPLSAGALQHLIAERVGLHLPRPTLARVHRASGGNPLFAVEFARTIAAGETISAGPMAVPASLEQLVRERVERLPRRLRPLLEVVAALGRATVPVVAHALDRDDIQELVDQAVHADLVTVDEDGVMRFTHPLLASAIYFTLPPHLRRRLHRRLRDAAESPEERGAHAALAAPRPDEATASLVAESARSAAARGALDAAAQLSAEAARLTPAREREARLARLLAAAAWLAETGDFEHARHRLDDLLADDLPARVRTDALLLRAECELGDRRALVSFLEHALAAAVEPLQRWHALIRLAHHGGWISGDVRGAAETAAQALEVAVGADEAPFVELSRAAVAFYRGALGIDDVTTPQPVGRPAPTPRMQWWHVSPAVSLGSRLLWAGELEPARNVLQDAFAAEDRAGRQAKAGFLLCSLSELEWRAGEWERADALAREATERLGDVNPTAYPRALVAAGSGRIDEAESIAAAALAWAAANDEHVAPPRFSWLLGLVELSRGNTAGAHRLLRQAQARLEECGIREVGYLPVLPDLVESAVALDRAGEAAPLVARLEAAASRGHRWAAPAAQRSRALLCLARRDAEGSAELARAAAEGFRAIGMPFERARALLVCGSALRRNGRRRLAGESLDEAADIFARLGAPLWLEQAERERRRASPRPNRGRDDLTAAETRVAALVAAGQKNKEVAAALYMTVGTVEAHLTRIYRKLGIRSRAELVRRVADGAVAVDSQQ